MHINQRLVLVYYYISMFHNPSVQAQTATLKIIMRDCKFIMRHDRDRIYNEMQLYSQNILVLWNYFELVIIMSRRLSNHTNFDYHVHFPEE